MQIGIDELKQTNELKNSSLLLWQSKYAEVSSLPSSVEPAGCHEYTATFWSIRRKKGRNRYRKIDIVSLREVYGLFKNIFSVTLAIIYQSKMSSWNNSTPCCCCNRGIWRPHIEFHADAHPEIIVVKLTKTEDSFPQTVSEETSRRHSLNIYLHFDRIRLYVHNKKQQNIE